MKFTKIRYKNINLLWRRTKHNLILLTNLQNAASFFRVLYFIDLNEFLINFANQTFQHIYIACLMAITNANLI